MRGCDCAVGLGALLLAGCTLPVRSLRTSAPGVVSVDLDKFPELRQGGGMIKIRHSRLGAIYLKLDRKREALKALHEALAINPHLEGAKHTAERLRWALEAK